MTNQERDELEQTLRKKLREKSTELNELWRSVNDHWGYEDAIYRFYSQSFKVYSLQKVTTKIVETLQSLTPGRDLHPWFLLIVREGTGKEFTMADNQRWTEVTRPIVERLGCTLELVSALVKTRVWNGERSTEPRT